MTQKLWQTGTINKNDFVEKFTIGDDFWLDQRLLPYDIQASKAHANMLAKIGILTLEENKKLQKSLDEIFKLHQAGKFEITRDHEDCHTAIEEYLTQKCGEAGKKIHTGRSRNDQVLTAMRLYGKSEVTQIRDLTENLIQVLQTKAEKSKTIPMPGYTHYQKAMPTDGGTWLKSFADGLADNLFFFAALEKILDQNPLGSAAGFGIKSFPLDREMTAEEMNFSRVQENPIYCGFSRGYFENIFLQTGSQIMLSLSRFAADMLFFTTAEFDFLKLDDIFTTGSSIMPQKRNPDVVEILQGKCSVYLAKQQEVGNIIQKLISGYHREFQLIKKPYFEGLDLLKECLQVTAMMIETMEFKTKNLEAAMTEELFVTEKAYKLVQNGMPFRDAYQQVKKEIFDNTKSSS